MTKILTVLLLLFCSNSFAQTQNPKLIDDSEPKTFEQLRQQENLKKLFPLDIRLTVVALNGNSVALDDKSVFTFLKAGQRLQGFGGCNQVSGDYRMTPRQLRFGPLNFTEFKCSEQGKKNEVAVFKAIQFGTHWVPNGHNAFTIYGKAGNVSFKQAF